MISPTLLSLQLHSSFSVFLSPNHGVPQHGYPKLRKIYKHSMRLDTKPTVRDGSLRINGEEALSSVPENVIFTHLANGTAFLGAVSSEKSSRVVFKLGVLEDNRLFCLYRFKLWWMIPRMGNSGSDVPIETQMLLLEATKKTSINGESHDPFYILFLMKGDSTIKASVFQEAVFVNYGENPFGLVNESMKK